MNFFTTVNPELRPIAEVASGLGISPNHVEPYGRDKAKVRLLPEPADQEVLKRWQ